MRRTASRHDDCVYILYIGIFPVDDIPFAHLELHISGRIAQVFEAKPKEVVKDVAV